MKTLKQTIWLTVILSTAMQFARVAAAEAPIIGRASVIDGDMIEIHGERIRLNSIEAPESWQTCIDRDDAE